MDTIIAHTIRMVLRSAIKLAVVALMVLSGWLVAHAEDRNARAAKDEIRGAMQHWLSAYNSKNIDALMSLYSDKIYYANNGNGLQRSVAAIRANYVQQFKNAPNVTIDFSEELVATGNDIAHIAGKYRVNIPATDGGVSHAFGRVLLIFERQDQQWKLVVDFDNTAPDIDGITFYTPQ